MKGVLFVVQAGKLNAIEPSSRWSSVLQPTHSVLPPHLSLAIGDTHYIDYSSWVSQPRPPSIALPEVCR